VRFFLCDLSASLLKKSGCGGYVRVCALMCTVEPVFVGVDVLEGRELVSCDSNGLSDPKVLLLAPDGSRLAKTAPKTLNPRWTDETHLLCLPPGSQFFDVQVWDEDLVRDDPMGTARVQLSGLCPHNVPREEWLLLKPIHKGDPVSGFFRLRLVAATCARRRLPTRAALHRRCLRL